MGLLLQVFKLFSRAVLISTLFPLLLITLWSILFGFPAGYIGFVTLASGVFSFFMYRKSRILAAALLLWVLCNLIFVCQTVRIYDQKRVQYFQAVWIERF